MKIRTHLSFLTVLVLTPFTIAQDASGKQDPGAGMPAPGKEHQNLKMAEGKWDATFEAVGMPPAKGVSEMKMVLGGFWLEDRFTCDFGGMPFEGRGMTGYDPIKGKYVASWTDSMSPGLMVSEGTYDAKTRTLTMVGDSYDQTGAKVKVRMLTIHKDANTVVFEMHQTGADGKEAKMMTITYTRSGTAGGKPAK